MDKPRISVIIGIYNCAPTLAEALDSLLAQTYQSFKVILCDDGSKDDTVKVASEYVANYPDKFILIRNERNMGLNFTLNHCLEYADTEYVARMDGDDISLPERFEKEITFLDSHPEIAIVSTPMIYFDEGGDF
ncbi:MAG: glycosyltransferase, partial [Muribaculaceae bacterium]|nr:glycosyltransferase [Muribaculaceae bacterium]